MILTRIKTINALMTLIRLGISTLFALVVKIQAEIKRLARPIVANLTTITTSSRSYYAFTHVSISVHVKIILTHKALWWSIKITSRTSHDTVTSRQCQTCRFFFIKIESRITFVALFLILIRTGDTVINTQACVFFNTFMLCCACLPFLTTLICSWCTFTRQSISGWS